jgi:hypothetical protein
MVVIPRLSYQMDSKSQILKRRGLSFSTISWRARYPCAGSKGKCLRCGQKDYRQWNAGAVRTHKLLFLGEQRKKEITCISGNPFGLIGVPNPVKRGLQQASLRRPELTLRLTLEDKLTPIVDQDIDGRLRIAVHGILKVYFRFACIL